MSYNNQYSGYGNPYGAAEQQSTNPYAADAGNPYGQTVSIPASRASGGRCCARNMD